MTLQQNLLRLSAPRVRILRFGIPREEGNSDEGEAVRRLVDEGRRTIMHRMMVGRVNNLDSEG